MKTIKVQHWKDIPENFTGVVEYPSGNTYWLKNGEQHREDGPAVEYVDGYKEWYLEDKEYFSKYLANYVVLDHYKGKHGIMWYRLLYKDDIFEYPDIPGLIEKWKQEK